MWTYVKNAFIVIVVTAIIWAFAESESLRSTEVRSVELTFQADPESKYVVDLTQGGTGVRGSVVRVDMVIEGPAAALDTVERSLRRTIIVVPGMDGLSTETGPHQVDIQTILSRHPGIASRGVTFRNLSPETVEATVDELVSRTVKIQVDMPIGAELDGSPEPKVTTAQVTLPASQASSVNDSTTLIARVDQQALSRLTAGRKETIPNVRLIAPDTFAGAPRLKIEPSGVDVTVTLRSKIASVKLPSVPVHVRIPAASFNQWDIDVPVQDRVLVDVTVSGPSDLIKQVQDRTLTIVATVPLSPDELDKPIPSKDAIFTDVPSGLRFDVANRTVRLNIKKRDRATQPAAVPNQ